MVEVFSSWWTSHLHQHPRWLVGLFTTRRTLVFLLWIVGLVMVFWWQSTSVVSIVFFRWRVVAPQSDSVMRAAVFNLTDFGAVGDGKTLNTGAFERAVVEISKLRQKGGGQLNVPAGLWLTAPFNLTSHMTLFLANGAVILGIEDESYWQLMPPLPSYGYGREHNGPRYGSLIHGQNLNDVIITGHNGTINGQGHSWWTKYKKKLLNYTRGPLVQLMRSNDIVISNITLRDSPFWTLHPYDCNNVTVSNVTILAPVTGAPNTDGIDPDSCKNVLIENSYICVGDDAIAIKSGWDQYGIAYGHPSTNITLRNLTVRSVVSAGVSIGSEMSGGVSNVLMENLIVWDSRRGIRIKTAPGRGGYVQNITFKNVTFHNLRVGIVIKTDYNEHPPGFDPKSLPIIQNISFVGIHGRDVLVPVRLHGSEEIPIKGVSFRDVSVQSSYNKHVFQCSYVEGRAIGPIFPAPCENLDIYDEQGNVVKRSESQNKTNIDYRI
ncbi:probable polygalacturonase [Zingiber officinale]|uniref:Polygalacturonase n=1 Tax=Zingiber officinale TaxID=94328 RepID=A0A8J5FUX4_ZINOF|nr:probable polygalacturonase [Zingiber officinale]KAG6496415.1 hypothetical protein ZIOFF_044282 [Zingiber officinale]